MDIWYQLELTWIGFIQSFGNWLVFPMQVISILGNEAFFLLVMPILYWSIDAELGFRFGVMLLLSNGIAASLKLVFHAPRPYWLSLQIKAFSSESSFGMPSGHAQNAASTWGLLSTRAGSTGAKITLAGLILLIGFSRIFLGMHFISDVLMGWIIGGALVWALTRMDRPVTRWLRSLSFPSMSVLALLSSIFLAATIIIPAASLQNWHIPIQWSQNALAAVPGEQIDPLNIDVAFTLSGIWFGLMLGMAWIHHYTSGYSTAGSPTQRFLRYLVGVAGLFLFWYILGKLFPGDPAIINYFLRFFRYTLIGLWVTALAPLLFEKLGLIALRSGKQGVYSSS